MRKLIHTTIALGAFIAILACIPCDTPSSSVGTTNTTVSQPA